jgi:hypothetical protein
MTTLLPTSPDPTSRYEHSATVLGRVTACKSLRLIRCRRCGQRPCAEAGTKHAPIARVLIGYRDLTSRTQHHAQLHPRATDLRADRPARRSVLARNPKIWRNSRFYEALHSRYRRLLERVRGTAIPLCLSTGFHTPSSDLRSMWRALLAYRVLGKSRRSPTHLLVP